LSDRAFEWSMISLTLVVIVWMVCSILFLHLPIAWAIISGFVIEVGVGVYLLYRWGQSYLERTR